MGSCEKNRGTDSAIAFQAPQHCSIGLKNLPSDRLGGPVQGHLHVQWNTRTGNISVKNSMLNILTYNDARVVGVQRT